MGYFVKPKSVRLPLSNGEFIDVKARLNTGETHNLMARLAPEMTPGEKTKLDSRAVLTSQVLAYLIGWSLTDDGAPVSIDPGMSDKDRLDIINNLDPEVFAEIRDAIDKHVEAVDAERLAAKNASSTVSV